MPTILVVDDDSIQRELTAYALTHHGFKVFCAADGEIAWQLLQTCSVDLILLDTSMPKLDGLGFLHLLRNQARFASLPVIMLTGMEQMSDVRRAAALGVRDYLLKSQCKMEDLLNRIRKYVGGDDSVPAASATASGAELQTQSLLNELPSMESLMEAMDDGPTKGAA